MYRLSQEDLDYWGPNNDGALYIHSLVTHPDFVGKGIGHQMIADVIRDMKTRNQTLLRLDCHAGNKKLCTYYEQLGFEKVGEKLMPHSLNNLYELYL